MVGKIPRLLTQVAEYKAEHSLSQELPYWDFIDDVVTLVDGSVVLGLKLQGINIETLDTNTVNHITMQLRALLNSLPDGYEFSFSFEAEQRHIDPWHSKLNIRGDGCSEMDFLRRVSGAHGIELPTVIHQEPDAPLVLRRLGYPLSGCVPAEPDSILPSKR